jgi:hypothetical protein
MAGGALIRVKAWTETISLSLGGAAHHLDGIEPRHAILEKSEFIEGEPG